MIFIIWVLFLTTVTCEDFLDDSSCEDELPHMCAHLSSRGPNNEYCNVYKDRWSTYCKATCTEFCTTLPSTTTSSTTSIKTTTPTQTSTESTTTMTGSQTTTSTTTLGSTQPTTTATTTIFALPPNSACGDLQPFCLVVEKDTGNYCNYTSYTCWKACELCTGPPEERCSNYNDKVGYPCEQEDCSTSIELDRFRVYQRCAQSCCNKNQLVLPA